MTRAMRAPARGGVAGLLWAAAQLFGSRMAGQAAGFLAAVVAARALGPEAFGPYSFALVAAVLASQIPGAGLDLSAVRISARYWSGDADRARGVLVVAGAVKLAFALAIGGLMAASAAPLGAAGALRPEMVGPLQFAGVAAAALALTEYAMAALQAQERFGLIFMVNMLAAALKLAPVLALAAVGALTLDRALAAFLASALAGAAVGGLAVWRSWSGAARWDGGTARELWAFSGWFTLAVLLGTLANSLDTLMLAQLAGPQATGIYASGRTLALPVSVVGGALGAVLLPRLSRAAESGPIGPALRHIGLRVAAGAALLCAALVALAPALLPLVFGPRYGAAVGVFQALVLAYGVQIVTWPVLAALMALDRPDIIARLNLAFLLATAAGYALLVPPLGSLGAALALLGAYLLMLPPYLLALRRALTPPS